VYRSHVIGSVLVLAVAGAAALAGPAGSAGTAVPLPPPIFQSTSTVSINELSAVRGTHGVGRYSATYSEARRTLVWRLDYKLTSGPITAVRVRARFGSVITSFTLCRRCVSAQQVSKKGPYFSVGGTVRNPSRNLVLLAAPPSIFGGPVSQVVAATAAYPAGELYGLTPTGVQSGPGGRCC
jgi:hypothetical protein